MVSKSEFRQLIGQGTEAALSVIGGTFLAMGGCGFVIFMIFASVIIGAFTWPYVLTALFAWGGKVVFVPWWVGAIIGCIPYIGRPVIGMAAALFVFLIKAFLGV